MGQDHILGSCLAGVFRSGIKDLRDGCLGSKVLDCLFAPEVGKMATGVGIKTAFFVNKDGGDLDFIFWEG